MGMYCLRALIPIHTARAGEIMEVLWSDYYGAVLFGEGGEIACIPHKGCRLEVVATAPTSHGGVNFLFPGHVIRYKRSFFFVDRFELPSGIKVGLWHLVGFKLQLAPSMPLPPVEDLTVGRRARRALDIDGNPLDLPDRSRFRVNDEVMAAARAAGMGGKRGAERHG